MAVGRTLGLYSPLPRLGGFRLSSLTLFVLEASVGTRCSSDGIETQKVIYVRLYKVGR